MLIWISRGQAFTPGGLQQVIVSSYEHQGSKRGLGRQQPMQCQGSSQLHGVIAAQLLTLGEIHGQVYEGLVNLHYQVLVCKIMGQIL